MRRFTNKIGSNPYPSQALAEEEAAHIIQHAEGVQSLDASRHHFALDELPRTLRMNMREAIEDSIDMGAFDF